MREDKQIFVVTDLGGGDGGKGGVVHKLVTSEHAHTVIKAGGGQGSHGVRTSKGQLFNFSHFGCGTFNNARTHISTQMVIDPLGLLVEGQMLKADHGITNAFDLLTVDRETICSTPFHQIASRLNELARKDKPRGTIGTGIGEAFYDAERYPDLVLRANDAQSSNLRAKIEAVRQQKIEDLKDIIPAVNDFAEADREMARELIEHLHNPTMVDATVDEWREFGRTVRLVPSEYLADHILSHEGSVVIECSHGILTDRYYGFHPHTSKLRTVPDIILTMIDGTRYDGEVIRIGVTRAYTIRHGAGPMVTENSSLVEKLLPGSSKEENRWQGKVRVGPLDFVALRYAIEVCGGPQVFDSIAVTWFDQLAAFGSWPVCCVYNSADDPEFFKESGDIKVHHGIGEAQLEHQQRLGQILNQCKPEVTSYDLPNGRSGQVALCQGVFREFVGVPVRMISFGPTENDKELR